MDSNDNTEIAKENSQPAEEPKAKATIIMGVLRVEIPLLMPNGEYVAYGMLYKAQRMAEIFYRTIEKETQQSRLVRPAGMPNQH